MSVKSQTTVLCHIKLNPAHTRVSTRGFCVRARRGPALVVLIMCCVTTLGTAQAQTHTEELKGFWRKGDANDFRSSVSPNSSKAVVYSDYPVAVDRIKEREQTKPLAPVQQVSGEKPREFAEKAPNQKEQEAPAAPTAPLSREQILAKYGAPDQPPLIRAQKDSPPAMQGLFEALNSGDKGLAWEYALALAKRGAEMEKMVSKATDYQMLAREALGMEPMRSDPKATESVDPTRVEVQDLLMKTYQEEGRKRLNIDAALAAEEALTKGEQGSFQPSINSSQIPVDPVGKVKLLVFFDEKASNVKDIVSQLQLVKDRFKADPNFSVLGLTQRTYHMQGLKMRSAELSFPFPLVNGEALAIDLRIQRYPTFVFLAVTTKETYRLEGDISVQAVEQTVKAMRGTR